MFCAQKLGLRWWVRRVGREGGAGFDIVPGCPVDISEEGPLVKQEDG